MTENRSTHKFGRSLIWRVMVVTGMLLIFPLVIFTSYSYRQEYKARVQGIFDSLNYLAQGEMVMMQELLVARFQLLDTLSLLNDGESQKQTDFLKKFDSTLVGQKEGNEIFFIEEREGQFFCSASSNEKQVGTDYSSLIAQAQGTLPNYQLFTGIDPALKLEMTYLMKKEADGFLIFGYPTHRLLNTLAILKDRNYPTTITVVNLQKEVLVTTDERLEGHSLKTGDIEIIAHYPEEQAFAFSFQGEKRLAVYRSIPYTTYMLIFDVDETAAFIPIHNFIENLLIPFAILLAVGLFATLFLIRRFSRPLNQLIDVMERVSHKEWQARFQDDRWGYEINHVGQIFNEMIHNLLFQMEEKRRIDVERESYQKELNIGHDLQKELLPDSLPFVDGLDAAARFFPAQEVNGDFYDLYMRPDGQLQIAMCDISGKGIYACFYGLMLRSILRSLSDKPCDELIQRANALFLHDSEQSSTFATLWIGLYDIKTHTLTYSCCGHNPPFLCRENGEMQTLHTSGIALGVVAEYPLATQSCQIAKGDLLFLYTDGLVERDNPKREQYGTTRLKEFLVRQKGKNPDEMLKALIEEVDRFAEGAPLPDDLSVLIIQRN